MKYKMIAHDSAESLSFWVTKALAIGWVLYGSPGRTSYEGYVTYFQAVTKEEGR